MPASPDGVASVGMPASPDGVASVGMPASPDGVASVGMPASPDGVTSVGMPASPGLLSFEMLSIIGIAVSAGASAGDFSSLRSKNPINILIAVSLWLILTSSLSSNAIFCSSLKIRADNSCLLIAIGLVSFQKLVFL